MLAKTTKLHQKQVIPIPENNTYDLKRWAAFSLRYVTAWSNWRLAYGMLRLQLTENELPDPVVWGWGGGVSLAELHLAHLQGCRTFQVSSRKDRQEARQRARDHPDRPQGLPRPELGRAAVQDGQAEYKAKYKRQREAVPQSWSKS